ncbi:MAG: hypothetical protein FWH22_00095 [Fibromonadales bacterium]|nr:hypothetical protein [Fibromonadales bacterium]
MNSGSDNGEYEMLTNSKDLYKQKMVKIPEPEFIVLYNGKADYPDFKEMRLSDSFILRSETHFLELVVKVYNINKGRNAEIASKSPNLSGYAELIAEIEDNKKAMSLDAAVKSAVKSCISRDILLYFLRERSSEVENMLLTEWNLKDALEVAREEAREEALAVAREEEREKALKEGREKERAELFTLWESGVSLEDAKRQLGQL